MSFADDTLESMWHPPMAIPVYAIKMPAPIAHLAIQRRWSNLTLPIARIGYYLRALGDDAHINALMQRLPYGSEEPTAVDFTDVALVTAFLGKLRSWNAYATDTSSQSAEEISSEMTDMAVAFANQAEALESVVTGFATSDYVPQGGYGALLY